MLALSLNSGAYLSESLRGAIVSIGQGQWRASLSLGLGYGQTLAHVVLPQALRIAVPSMSNTLISLIKDTSLVSVITVTELMLATKEVIATTFQPLPLYLAAACRLLDAQPRLRTGAARRRAAPEQGARRRLIGLFLTSPCATTSGRAR